jgi:hypothetical protein
MPRISLAYLQQQMQAVTNQIASLEQQKATHAAEIRRIDRELLKLAGPPDSNQPVTPATRNTNPAPGQSLPDRVMQVMTASGKPMKVADVKDAVMKMGYTSAGDLGQAVSAALASVLTERKLVVRVSRGVYKLVKAKAHD